MDDIDKIIEKIADIRDVIPGEWFNKQHPSALSASVGSPYEAICYIQQYIKDLENGL